MSSSLLQVLNPLRLVRRLIGGDESQTPSRPATPDFSSSSPARTERPRRPEPAMAQPAARQEPVHTEEEAITGEGEPQRRRRRRNRRGRGGRPEGAEETIAGTTEAEVEAEGPAYFGGVEVPVRVARALREI